ncbi:MAG: hypothetical protein COT34_00820 [Candidatus Nealsonbacteria bacterium CG08_land_8_20_14_0_20_43_11]|uniref:Uncharacterized protein n=1 Tax=Candidatus Nealsonbacteria bacterium CG08_land_8_20_14_0_20_43_11 TaxID=1974706 RepID=A0A2M6T1C9_9BACT|nr:MAG: hypothetical protein COT34_00820 [Candidatus Nealsonbacteria bacterium CG08_land_8_20_14_0_20_43_11]
MDRNGIIALRREGKTYSEIANVLKIPKSTVAWHLRNVKLSKSLQRQLLKKSKEKWRKSITQYNNIYAKVRAKEARLRREGIQKKASEEITGISKKDLLLIGTSLFWAEGSKSHRWRLCLANSDPEIIKVMMKFFREICHIPDEKIKALVHIYPGLNYKKVLTFWTKIAKLPKKNFYKPQTQISRASKRKRDRNTLPYGTLHLTAGNTLITSQVKGWIQGILEKT